MTLVDREIAALVSEKGIIEHYMPECLTNIGYDLRAKNFTQNAENNAMQTVQLNPGDSAFVAAEEDILLPDTMLAKLTLKNSRIRQGLLLDAPIYQPGHHTKVFFRLTNLSANCITLKSGEKYAMIQFETLSAPVEHPYDGTYSDEFSYRGMGKYKDVYADQIQEIENKTEDLKSMEKSIYGNVLVILTVFVALFSFLSTNISLVAMQAQAREFLVYNFVTLGCISALVALLRGFIKNDKQNYYAWIPVIIFFIIAFCVFMLL